MSAPAEDEVQYWHSRSAAARTIVKGILMTALGLTVIAIIVFWGNDAPTWLRVVFSALMAIPVFKGIGLVSTGIGMTTQEGRLAVGVSAEGIRAPGIGLTPWAHIEKLQIYSQPRGAGYRSQIADALGKDTDLRLIMTRTDDPANPMVELARTYSMAFAGDLAGGDHEFAQIAGLVYTAAVERGIPMTLLHVEPSWPGAHLGIPPAPSR